MKKIVVFMLMLTLSFSVRLCYADDLDVQAVGEGSSNSKAMNFDDVTFGKTYKINGYAAVNLLGFKFVNMFAQWDDGKAGKTQKGEGVWGGDHDRYGDCVFYQKPINGKRGYYYEYSSFKTSGNEADFAWLKVDVRNLQKTEASFMKDISIKVIYDDEYEYTGWVRQFNYDFSKSEIYRYKETTLVGWPVCLSPVDEMSIQPMYTGHYAFGCTLPNFVVEDKNSPLRMIIQIGDSKLTYNIRK